MKKSRTEEYTMVHYKTIDQLCCDNCGTTVDVPAMSSPEGWSKVFRTTEGQSKWWDFCEWECLIGWANAQPETGPGGYIQAWQETVDILKATKEAVK